MRSIVYKIVVFVVCVAIMLFMLETCIQYYNQINFGFRYIMCGFVLTLFLNSVLYVRQGKIAPFKNNLIFMFLWPIHWALPRKWQ